MLRNALLMAVVAASFHAHSQVNMTQVGQLSYQALRNSDLSNLWGYTDEFGNEYALVGVNGQNGSPNTGGLSVVDLSDPANPQEIFFHAGPNSIWREVKTWGDYAYVTTEADYGLLIVDLSPLPFSNVLPVVLFEGNGWETSHSLFIDENGRLYIHGANRGNGGVIMYDLTADPMNPVEVGEFDMWYCHDSYARGDTLYAAHVYAGFFTMVDVSDPASPVLLGQQSTPNQFTHNVWLDDSGDHLYTTDERTNSYIGSYNVDDPTDIQFQDKVQSDPGSGTVPHNTYWLNNYLVTSYYTFGVVIHDASRPDNLVEVGHFDTSPNFSGDGFNGAWGVYPFFQSGRLIVSDIQEGLVILDPTYVQACWLEGTITDAITGQNLVNATVTLDGTGISDVTGFNGRYTSGYHTGGTFSITVQRFGYFPQTVGGIVLANGLLTIQDVALTPLPSFTYEADVRDAVTLAGIPDAQVQLEATGLLFNELTDADGNVSISTVFEETYATTVGRWGWRTTCQAPQPMNIGFPAQSFLLDPVYADDFALDLGWTSGGDAESGGWVRAIPIGTNFGGTPVAPGADLAGDCFGYAYVTGNGGGAAGDDDVDDGEVWLASPVFDASAMPDPHVRYSRWFYNVGGSGNPNDTLHVYLTNGTDTVEVETVTVLSPGLSQWVNRLRKVSDFLSPSATMKFIMRTADRSPGHLLEAGLDGFEVLPNGTVGENEMEQSAGGLLVWPVPGDDQLWVRDAQGRNGLAQVLDLGGRVVRDGLVMRDGLMSAGMTVPSGAYLVRVQFADGSVATVRWMRR
ncbi:MAG: choice-of-anchor B family protein [Flavobacteriales bacterium]|nr:choice-of-anchor B family protein [Flavobacteriales bacterium]